MVVTLLRSYPQRCGKDVESLASQPLICKRHTIQDAPSRRLQEIVREPALAQLALHPPSCTTRCTLLQTIHITTKGLLDAYRRVSTASPGTQ